MLTPSKWPTGALKSAPIVGFFIMVLISTVILPLANDSEDFYFFSSWNMFAFGSEKPCVDITWDNGKTFLFKDHRQKILASGVNVHALFYLTNTLDTAKIQDDYLRKIKSYCGCETVELVTLNSSLFDHFVLKKEASILRRMPL